MTGKEGIVENRIESLKRLLELLERRGRVTVGGAPAVAVGGRLRRALRENDWMAGGLFQDF